MGGGSNQNGKVKAVTAEEAAANPFFGVFGAYSRETDPWVLYDLDQPSPVRDYLRYFYNQTIAYTEQTGVSLALCNTFCWFSFFCFPVDPMAYK